MEIPSNSQLVPYHQRLIQVTPRTRVSPRVVAADVNPAVKRYAQMNPPRFSRNSNQPDIHESVYDSSRRQENRKLNNVGLLIDIYT